MLAANVQHEFWRAISFAIGMTWEILWALILGFTLSAAVQAVVPTRIMHSGRFQLGPATIPRP